MILLLDLHIPPAELARFYRGAAQVVRTRDAQGRRVQFPAAALRPFVSSEGIHGRFRLEVDGTYRLRSISRI